VVIEDEYMRLLMLYREAQDKIIALERQVMLAPLLIDTKAPQEPKSIDLQEQIKNLTEQHELRTRERDHITMLFKEEIGLNFRVKTAGLYRDAERTFYRGYAPQAPNAPYKSPATKHHTTPANEPNFL
jgi:hypothetical protein